MRSVKRAVVTGMIATYPVGGVAWDYGQYAVALEELGYEVWYLEDTGGPTYDPVKREYGSDCSYGVRFVEEALGALSPSLSNRWAFRDEAGDLHGMNEEALGDLVAGADLFLNVSGGTLLRDAYVQCPCKVLIDSDPGWNHFVNYPKWDANPGWQDTHGFRAHDWHFTYAERIGYEDCGLPTFGIEWRGTRPPVCLDRWNAAEEGASWTTVMTWNNFRQLVVYDGREYGTKEREFAKIESIPSRCSDVKFEIAVGGSDPPLDRWSKLGWKVVDSQSVSTTVRDYRQYIEGSRAELSVAKNLYVAPRTGWFSCRSVCYLAAGRPVVVQDTGFSDFLPTGEGLLCFDDELEAATAVERVEANYRRHQQAAREVAAEYFDGRRVLGDLLKTIGLE